MTFTAQILTLYPDILPELLRSPMDSGEIALTESVN